MFVGKHRGFEAAGSGLGLTWGTSWWFQAQLDAGCLEVPQVTSWVGSV